MYKDVYGRELKVGDYVRYIHFNKSVIISDLPEFYVVYSFDKNNTAYPIRVFDPKNGSLNGLCGSITQHVGKYDKPMNLWLLIN